MSANVTKKRNTSEAFAEEDDHADKLRKRPATMNQAWSPINQLPSSSIHPPERPESVFSSIAILQDNEEDEQKPELYTYKPLGPEQIRLLRLHPGQRNDPIYCSLVTDSTSAPSSYEALSYVWGERYPAHHILLSDEEPGCCFTVPRVSLATTNLYDALIHIRRSDRPLILWVDALCINQEDTHEKSQQVSLMSEIYNNAHRVLVWLGNENASTSWAVSNIRNILRLGNSRSTNSGTEVDKATLPLDLYTAWTQFARSPWFHRSWVIQEVLLPPRATFIRGSSQLDLLDFQMIVDHILPYLSSRHDMVLEPAQSDSSFQDLDLEPLRIAAEFFKLTSDSIEKSADGHEIIGRKRSLFELITQTSDSEATDPRDKIFALLSVSKQDSLGPKIRADYSRSLSQVCYSVVKSEIEISQSLDILLKPWAPRVTESLGWGFGTSDIPFVTWQAGKPSWIPLARDRLSRSVQHRGFHSSKVTSRIGPDFVGIAKPFNAASDYVASVQFRPRAQSLPSIPQRRYLLGRRPDRESTPTGDFGSIHNPQAIKNSVLAASGIEIGTITDVSSRMVDGNVSRDCLEMVKMSFSEGCEGLQNKTNKVWERLWRILVADRNNEGLAAPTSYGLAFLHVFKQALQLRGIDTEEMLGTETNSNDNVLEFLSRVRDVTWNRRMFSSNVNNYQEVLFGLVPRGARVGDRLVILFGCSVPIVIRDVGKEYVKIVGEAYVHGKMHGEAFYGLSQMELEERTQEFQIV